MNVWLLYLVLLRATVMSFSGFASVPVVRQDLVGRRAMLTDQQLWQNRWAEGIVGNSCALDYFV